MQRKGIMLIEDNPDDEELALLALEKIGLPHELSVLRDGQEVMNFLNDIKEPSGNEQIQNLPKVIFLDLNLPKIGGLDLLRAIRANPVTVNIPVVILTSSNEEMDILSSYNLGANSYVRKPVAFKQFMKVVQQLGEYWLELNEITS